MCSTAEARRIGPRAAVELVVASSARQDIVAVATVKGVGAGAASQHIAATPTLERVVVGAALEVVTPVEANQRIVARIAKNDIVIQGAGQGFAKFRAELGSGGDDRGVRITDGFITTAELRPAFVVEIPALVEGRDSERGHIRQV